MLLLSLLLAAGAQAQDIRYVSDKQFVPLRSGAGNDYRIIHRGIPSGTRLKVARTSQDKVWAEITTDRGTTGWIRTQYLMQNVPAQTKVDAAIARAEKATQKSAALAAELETIQVERVELINQLSSNDSELGTVSEQLTQLKQISGNAVQLDIDNRRLVEATENLRSEVEMLEAENLRLQDKLESEDFLNGALAVLLGVIIALVAPRLVPKRRKSSSWA
ncbi:MAG: TIGR04211 family SH3 domain-containing protein [Gammaproteobacteria bacterium]|nr:TIGR04211 family SH3 domain-containing protein [Gammaproteobacteria bacterium]